MIIPQPISIGDTIGIVAPSSPFDQILLEEGIAMIRQLGFEVMMPEDLMCPNSYLANSDEVRAGHINRYFEDETVKAIVCARGGYGASRILPLIDYEIMGNNPKIFIGFSDITFLLNAFYRKCGLVSFHGPMVSTLTESDEVSRHRFSQILTSPMHPLSLKGCSVICSGIAKGPIVGGNFTALCHMMGTPYQPEGDGRILFLEDRKEALYRIDRMLVHLNQSGFLNNLSGMILGTFEDCGDYERIISLVEDTCRQLKIPLITGLMAGHGAGNLAIPLGLPAVLDTENLVLRFA